MITLIHALGVPRDHVLWASGNVEVPTLMSPDLLFQAVRSVGGTQENIEEIRKYLGRPLPICMRWLVKFGPPPDGFRILEFCIINAPGGSA